MMNILESKKNKHNGPKNYMAAIKKADRESEMDMKGPGFKSNDKKHNTSKKDKKMTKKLNINDIEHMVRECVKRINEVNLGVCTHFDGKSGYKPKPQKEEGVKYLSDGTPYNPAPPEFYNHYNEQEQETMKKLQGKKYVRNRPFAAYGKSKNESYNRKVDNIIKESINRVLLGDNKKK